MAKSEIQNTSHSANKSWVELCDEENSSNDSIEDFKNEESISAVNHEQDYTAVEVQNHTDTIKKEVNTVSPNENTPLKDSKNCKGLNKEQKSGMKKDDEIKTEIEIKTEVEDHSEKSASPWQFSYATVLKNSASKTNIPASPISASKHRSEKKEVLETTELDKSTKTVKREIQREFLQEDLSLSSHLDIFHMQSPMKLEPFDEEMASPLKSSSETRSAKKRLGKPKLSFNEEDAVLPDDVLMPSPRKVTRLSTRRKREPGESPLTNKRSKRSSESRTTPKCVVPVDPPDVELETDEQVLLRRQKQIDYGKNTVGYDRYCQVIPKEKRNRKHPHTPPKHIKYSRRAWDGLVKQWRQQLHFWDPPSEGGGNPRDFDMMSSMSEASSDTTSLAGSLPATPREKPRRSTRNTRSSESSSCTDGDVGCSPMKD